MSSNHPNGVCDECGAPATHRLRNHGQQECVLCARQHGAELNGEARAALETIGFAISLARNAGITDNQLRDAFEAILTDPHSIGEHPIGGDHVLRLRGLDWERVFEPIS